jgi:CBS domain-containing protein
MIGSTWPRTSCAWVVSAISQFDPSERRAFIRSVEVKEVMTATVETVPPHASLRDAGRTMLRLRIGCLPVVDDAGVFLGMLTETDLLRAALEVDEEEDAIVVSESKEGGE